MQRSVTRSGGQRPNNKKSLYKHPPEIIAYNPMLFNTCQIPDNPGYMDFNNPTIPPLTDLNGTSKNKRNSNKNKEKTQIIHGQQVKFTTDNISLRNNIPLRERGRRSMTHMNLRGRLPPQVMAPPPPPPPPPHMFQPQPLIPPMAIMNRGRMARLPMELMPPYLRRNPPRGPMPIPPPMMPPLLPLHGMPHRIPSQIPYNEKAKKSNNKMPKKTVKGKSTIKTLKNLINQYPMNKPWVTDDIRVEYEKKTDIENRLQGNKDDKLFAQFKQARDKFVASYENAREIYLKEEATAIKKKKDVKNNKQRVKETTAISDLNGAKNDAILNK